MNYPSTMDVIQPQRLCADFKFIWQFYKLNLCESKIRKLDKLFSGPWPSESKTTPPHRNKNTLLGLQEALAYIKGSKEKADKKAN